MPLYEYACRECGTSFERRRAFEQRLDLPACPECGAESELRLSVPGRVGAGGGAAETAPVAAGPGCCCGGGACGLN